GVLYEAALCLVLVLIIVLLFLKCLSSSDARTAKPESSGFSLAAFARIYGTGSAKSLQRVFDELGRGKKTKCLRNCLRHCLRTVSRTIHETVFGAEISERRDKIVMAIRYIGKLGQKRFWRSEIVRS